jgi:hypothetical protein
VKLEIEAHLQNAGSIPPAARPEDSRQTVSCRQDTIKRGDDA